MNRLYILLTVMVVMLTAPLFGAHEALAEDFLGTAFNDPLFGTEGDDYLKGRAGDDYLDAASEDVINCGAGFDQVETIHRDDITKSNCERALGPRKGNID